MSQNKIEQTGEQDLLMMIGFGYLGGKIELGHVSFSDLEQFTQPWDITPRDGKPHSDIDPGLMHCLEEIAKAAVKRYVLQTKEVTIEKLKLVLGIFGYMVAKGEVTPTSLANLCKCQVSFLHTMLQEALANKPRSNN